MRRTVALLLLLAFPIVATAREVTMPWHDMRTFIHDKKVTVTTDKGVVSGRVVSIADDSLNLRTGRQTQAIPRASVSTVKLTRYDGPARKVGLGIGFVFGLVAGIVMVVYVGLDETHQDSREVRKAKTIAAWLGTWGGSILTGWLIGRLIDREVLLIRPIPERAGSLTHSSSF
jgi:hypothetical protein